MSAVLSGPLRLRAQCQEPLNAPFLKLIGWFPEELQEGKRPTKEFGETAHSGRKTAH